MEKKYKLLVGLLLMGGTVFAQSSSPAFSPVPLLEQRPHLKYTPDAKKFSYQPDLLQENKQLNAIAGEADKLIKEELFYSNMPIARVGKPQEAMPIAQPDSSVQYHLLQKRFKVLPLPTGQNQEPKLEK